MTFPTDINRLYRCASCDRHLSAGRELFACPSCGGEVRTVLGVGEIEASRAPIIVTNAEGQPIVAIIPFDLL